MPARPVQLGEVLIREQEIQKRVVELGEEIARDYSGRSPLMIAVLRGAAVFHADLIRHIDLKLRVDFVSADSYGTAAESSGKVEFAKDVESDIQGLDVILVEDIVDTGLTVDYLLQKFRDRDPASLHTCALLSKPSRRQVEVPIDYLGFEIPGRFVVGYGLDYDQKYRNLPFIAALDGVETTNDE
jgi:hypoxanthine phosphoribosyltransferase